ncbi:MAG: hypothetical protein L3J11_06225 [Draconibacterium sp.]|nr:hypothetical protein [Draconibacterium sp.]
MLEKLKKKWEINSDFRMIVILFVFALSGSSTLFFRKGIFHLLGVTTETSLLIKIPLYILIIIPSYQILFLFIGTLFGQFKFVRKFEKKMLARFKFKK